MSSFGIIRSLLESLADIDEKGPAPFAITKGGEKKWPIGDLEHAKRALTYVLAGRGLPTDWSEVVSDVEKKWGKNPEIQELLAKAKAKVEESGMHEAQSPGKLYASYEDRFWNFQISRGNDYMVQLTLNQKRNVWEAYFFHVAYPGGAIMEKAPKAEEAVKKILLKVSVKEGQELLDAVVKKISALGDELRAAYDKGHSLTVKEGVDSARFR